MASVIGQVPQLTFILVKPHSFPIVSYDLTNNFFVEILTDNLAQSKINCLHLCPILKYSEWKG